MITYNEFKKLLLSGLLQPTHKGRYWVGISLSEAETIRRIIHIRNNYNSSNSRYYKNIIPNFNTEICLRYNPITDHHGYDFVLLISVELLIHVKFQYHMVRLL